MNRTILAAVLVAAVGAADAIHAQAPEFCYADDPGVPSWDIEDYDPIRDADDWQFG